MPVVIVALLAHSISFGTEPSAGSEDLEMYIRNSLRTAKSVNELAEQLGRLPSDEIVVTIADLLATDHAFEDSLLRGRAYQALVHFHGQRNPQGRRQLQSCLGEVRFRGLCAGALGNVPLEGRDEVIVSLAGALRATNVEIDAHTLIPVLRALGRFGQAASSHLGVVEKVFENRLLPQDVRAEALKSVMMIGKISDVCRYFEAEDPILIVGAIGFMANRTDGQFDGQKLTKDRMREYVREASRNDDRETRELALLALMSVYGLDAVAGSADEGYSLHPSLEDALIAIAKSDPDEALRAKAQEVLETKEQRLQRLVRRRENPDRLKRQEE